MKRILFLILVFSGLIYSQEKSDLKLTGSLSLDSKLAISEMNLQNYFNDEQNGVEKKSPYLAVALSAILPGAGEFYTENYLKTAIFVAAEITAITVGLIYDKKGDDQTIVFQNYANSHWNTAKYAQWTIDNLQHLNEQMENNLRASDYANLFYDAERTKVNLAVLNKLENDIGGWYSHRLPQKGDQQYYEMIGKYPQFNVGWDDYADGERPFIYGDPLTENFKYYSGERGEANDFYSVAHTAVLVVVANHILSALDAAWSASRYNKNLEASAEVKKFDLGFRTIYYPQLNLQYRF